MRVYKKRTDRQTISEDVLRKAISLVMKNRDEKGFSIRKVAKKFKMSCASLSRYIKRYNEGRNELVVSSDEEDDSKVLLKKQRAGQVFNNENEAKVIQYSHQYGQIMGGLRPKQIRYIAYQCATKYSLKYPPSWDKNKRTGEDWLTHFLKRKKEEFTFLPPPRPMPKGVKVNRKDVENVYEKLRDVCKQYDFKGNDIWNMDQVDASTSAEDTITIVTAANAIGNSLPPMLIVPREKLIGNVADGPIDCIYTDSEHGPISDESFVTFIKHFVKCTRPDALRPVLLLIDNRNAVRITVSILDLCRQESIVMLALPAGCEHRLQPLDVAVFGSFKNLFAIYADEWMKNNPSRLPAVSDLPGIIRDSWIRAITPMNITTGFAKSGIYPLQPEKYDDKDYTPFDGTHFLVCRDEPYPSNHHVQQPPPVNNNIHSNIHSNPIPYQPVPPPAAMPMMPDYSPNMASMVWDRNDHCGWSGVQGI